MNQYCRYCAFCFEGDCFYCSIKDVVLFEEDLKRVNHCKDFAYSELGDIITGKQYQPRKKSTAPKAKQYTLLDEEPEGAET